MKRQLLAGTIALLALGGCGGGEDEPAATPEFIGDELGCDELTEADTEELFVSELYECERDGEATSIYTFASSSARDSWREVAEEFGIQVENEGPTWLEVD